MEFVTFLGGRFDQEFAKTDWESPDFRFFFDYT